MIYEPWRGSVVIMNSQTNLLPRPNPSRVRYMGECFSIPTLSLSEAERRVYHNHAPPGRVVLSYLRHDRTSGSLRRFASDCRKISDFASWRHPGSLSRFAWEAAACRVTTGGRYPWSLQTVSLGIPHCKLIMNYALCIMHKK